MTLANGFATSMTAGVCRNEHCRRRARLNICTGLCYRCFAEQGVYMPTPEQIRAACEQPQPVGRAGLRRPR